MLLVLASLDAAGCHALNQSDTDLISAVEDSDSQKAEHLHHRGVAFLKQGKPAKAEIAFHNAIIADESFGPALNNIGLLYYDKGDLYSAAWSFERAMASMPNRPEPTNNLGMTLEAAGRFDEAIEMYQTAWSQEATNPEFLGNLVRAKLRRGDRDYEIFEELQELIFLETRPEWRAFAQHQLTMLLRFTDPGPQDVRPSRDEGTSRDLELLPTPTPLYPPGNPEPIEATP